MHAYVRVCMHACVRVCVTHLGIIEQLHSSKAVVWVGIFLASLLLHRGHHPLQLGLLLLLAALGALQQQRRNLQTDRQSVQLLTPFWFVPAPSIQGAFQQAKKAGGGWRI